MIHFHRQNLVRKGQPRTIAASAFALLIVASLGGCAANQSPMCSLNVVDQTQAQINGGHKEPISPTAFSRQFLANGLTVVCAGDYKLSLGSAPYPASVLVVTGNDPVAAVQAALNGATNTAATSGYGSFDVGDDGVIVKRVTLAEYPDRTDLWAIQYFKDINK